MIYFDIIVENDQIIRMKSDNNIDYNTIVMAKINDIMEFWVQNHNLDNNSYIGPSISWPNEAQVVHQEFLESRSLIPKVHAYNHDLVDTDPYNIENLDRIRVGIGVTRGKHQIVIFSEMGAVIIPIQCSTVEQAQFATELFGVERKIWERYITMR